MNADAELDALVRRDLGVALDHRPLDFDGAVHCIDNAPELDNCAVARALDDPAMMHGDGWVDQVAPKGPKPCKDAIFVRASKPRIPDDIGYQDRREFPGLVHGAGAEVRSPVARGLSMVRFHAALKEGAEAESNPRVSARETYPRRN
jgi:hypothetical protein